MENIDLQQYFDRISYVFSGLPTYQNLANLQQKHMQAIAFENLDPFTGSRVFLQPQDLTEKLLKHQRGGYCYEQNLLFANVLKQLDYQVRMLAARVVLAGEDPLPAKTHMLLLVSLDQDYIVDTGFGGNSPTAPLKLKQSDIQETPNGTYKIVEFDDYYVLQANLKDELKSLYQFDLCKILPADYEPMNYYMGVRKESHFRQELLLSIVSGNTRLSMHNNVFSIRDTNYDLIKQEKITNIDQWFELVQNKFNINVSSIKNCADKSTLIKAMLLR